MKHLLITIAALVLVGCGSKEKSISIEAIKNSDLEKIKKAIAAGADVNAPIEIRTGNTTLENILKLKSFKSTINIENSCAIMIAIQYSDTNTVKLLIDNGADVVTEDGDTPLHYAAMYGRLGIFQMLIAKGADVNAKDRKAWTPLHIAAFDGEKEIIELLIAKGADMNEKTKGSTPLDLAIVQKKTEIADLLRKHGGKTVEELKAEGK